MNLDNSSKIFEVNREKKDEALDTQLMQQLLCDLIKGEELAFKKIYKAYFAHLHHYSLSIVQDSDVASDIVQNIFVLLWEGRKKLNPNKSLRSYLLRATHNNSLRYLKTTALHKKHQVNIKREKEKEEQENVIVLHEHIYSKSLTTLLDKLPKRSRQVTFMSHIEGKKNIEIATDLGISVRTVETILYRSIKKLRELNNINIR